jgi:ABC-type polysaccharide/polyol phosphate export permease
MALVSFFHNLFLYREYLKQSVLRDLRKKYKRSSLGYVWTMLHPLGMMLVMSTVLSKLMGVTFKEYAVFFLSGLIIWNYFNSTCMMSLHAIRANARLFSQVAIPKYLFVVSIACSNFANLLFALVPLILVMALFGRPFHLSMIAIPLVLISVFIVTLAVSLILAVANVFFEDTLHLSEVAFQALYFLTPVLFARDKLPEWLIDYLILNPLFLQIEFFRSVLLTGTLPQLSLYVLNLTGSLILLMLALFFFRKNEDKFLYHL